MADVLIQYVTMQRTETPTGRRVLSDGTVQRVGPENARPGPDDLLERDRDLSWVTIRTLTPDQLQTVKDAIQQSGFFDLPPKLLINYCKEDPGAMIWHVNLDGQRARVVLWDPKPRRSAELDHLLSLLKPILESA